MKKAVFISSPQMPENYHECNKEKEKYFNDRTMDIERTSGLLTVMKQFACEGNVKSAVLRITSLGVFEALLNGKRIGHDGTYDT